MEQNECKGYEEWMSHFITEDKISVGSAFDEVIIYIAWDEVGANVVRISSSLQEVVSALKGYAESL